MNTLTPDETQHQNSLDQLRKLYNELETQNLARKNGSDKICGCTITVKHEPIDPNLLHENLKSVLQIVNKYKK